ncbi:hypothetical protein [Argonema antarcticum]|uniref:hypothetical protein n=1 Tax=Argonema antarcticum TaxID=2942763 RepID=UPI0020134460|nr:hypothetical protein [Argonema antarcticum]MCL1474583.1 hypothetical protein [Argonema antarcticum A004/B2]
MTQANELAQQIYDLDEDVLVAKLGTLSEEMGGDLTGESAPRGVSLDSIDVEFETRAPISQAAIQAGQKVFDRVNAEAYQILCTPLGDLSSQEALDKALEENYTKAAGMLAPVLVSSLGLAPAVAAIVASLIIKKISKDIAGGICSTWAKNLNVSEIPTGKEEGDRTS